MNSGLSRRELLQAWAAATAAGLPLAAWAQADAAQAQAGLYELPPFGQVSLLHMTDCHAQLLPLHYREPELTLPAGVAAGSAMAHACTGLDFESAARRFGRLGGFAHLATLVQLLRASRPGALLLDGGDSWQGSATALWTAGQDMVDACRLLGVDVMTGHWEFTHGMARVQQIVGHDLRGQTDFVAHNVQTADFGDPVFAPFVIREINRVPCAIIGQAYPFTPIAHPRALVADWRFGIQEAELQAQVQRARAQGAQLVVLLSHNGLSVDLKLASRVSGIDAILGGHTHDAVPQPVAVRNPGGVTLVTNAGSHGKFLGVLDLAVRNGRLSDWRYRLLPVFANQLKPDPAMAALVAKLRAPFAARLAEPLATTEGLLVRRGRFNGSWDQLICDALRDELGADIAFSPGFRWGGSLLPGDTITREHLMDQLAITYPQTTLRRLTGAQIKAILEDVADNLFHPDPYYQQGGDMVRTGGLAYRISPAQPMGQRISALRLRRNSQPLEADQHYTVAGWAPVMEPEPGQPPDGPPVWDVVERWLRAQGGRVAAIAPDQPEQPG
jgi:sulfur-oxidizing protein SoxB